MRYVFSAFFMRTMIDAGSFYFPAFLFLEIGAFLWKKAMCAK